MSQAKSLIFVIYFNMSSILDSFIDPEGQVQPGNGASVCAKNFGVPKWKQL